MAIMLLAPNRRGTQCYQRSLGDIGVVGSVRAEASETAGLGIAQPYQYEHVVSALAGLLMWVATKVQTAPWALTRSRRCWRLRFAPPTSADRPQSVAQNRTQ